MTNNDTDNPILQMFAAERRASIFFIAAYLIVGLSCSILALTLTTTTAELLMLAAIATASFVLGAHKYYLHRDSIHKKDTL